MDLGQFFSLLNSHPVAYVALLVNLGVVFVNGWTDGPNAIATCVTTRCMKPRSAVVMCAILNFIGVMVIGLISAYVTNVGGVSETIAEILQFPSDYDVDRYMVVIAAGLLSIIVVSLLCTWLGFPSSESNALVGGLTGAGIAATVLIGGVNPLSYIGLSAWIKVLVGFFGSIILGFFLGWLLTYLIQVICKNMTRGKTTKFFTKGQIFSAGAMSFVHGVQDGAKFIGIFILVAAVLSGEPTTGFQVEWYMYTIVAIVMFAGTMMGGYNIIKTMGNDIVKLHKYQAFATDIASAIALLLATGFGLPVSTSTVKSTSIIGSGAARNIHHVKWKKAGQMLGSWILLFPLSIIIGFAVTMLFIWMV